ncbi:peptidoglycan DD-metalloendopeptidase family protein [Glutamicibacter protophormiae]|uniref:aggregation-promoting factor C-terminal-like domain-containing protein n=1 Tax=Glutamicibacter protophormiae TaxID=37930 RepID=UPI003A8F68A8
MASAQRKVEQTSRAAQSAQKTYVEAMKTSSAAHETLQKAAEESEKATKEAGKSSSEASKTYASGWRGVAQRVKSSLTGGVKSAAAAAKKEAESGGKRAGTGFSSAFKGAVTGLAAGFSVAAVGGFVKDSLDLAGAAEQSVGAIDTVFKENSAVMHQWAADAKKNVGISANEYRELGTLLGSQLKNAGTPMDELADKTNGLITMGADMASMFGGTTKEAIEAISSALKGEMDPIERYGITLNQAALEAEGLSKGILKPVVDSEKVSEAATKMTLAQKKYNEVVKKHGKDSDEAQRAQLALTSAERAYNKATAGKVPKLEGEAKALAVQAALYGQSADAQGNFMREEDTFEHKRQVAIASWQDLKQTLGNVFLPVATQVFSFIGDQAIPALESFGGWVKQNEGWLKPLAIAVASVAGGFLAFRGAISVISGLTAVVTGFKGAFAALNVVMKANIFGIIISAVAGLVAVFMYFWNTNEGFRNFFIGAWEAIKNAVGVAVEWIKGALATMGDFFSTVWEGIKVGVAAVVDFFTNTVAPMFMWFYENVITPIWNGIKLVIAIAVTAVIGIIKMWVWVWQNMLAPAITFVWEKVLKPVFQAIGSFFAWVWNNLLKPAFGAVVAGFKAVGTFFSWVWNSVLKPVFRALGDFFVWVWNTLLKPAFGWVKQSFTNIVNSIKATWNNVLKPVFNALGTFFKWVWETILKPAIDAVKNHFQNFVNNVKWFWNNILKPVFNAIGTFMRDTVAPMFKRAVDGIKSVWSSIKGAFKSVWDWVSKFVFDPVKKLITETIPNAFQSGVDFIKEAWNKVANIARKPINFVIETVYGGLRDTFNKVAGTLGLPEEWRLPEVKPLGEFYAGGWTGPGHKYQEAGVVHADEFVIRKESQRSIERSAPGFMDSLNRFGAQALGYANGGLVRPVRGGALTSGFGASRGRYPHAGLDFAVPIGTPVHAAMDGTVLGHQPTGRTGRYVFLSHPGNRNTYYGHLSQPQVSAGQQVKAGQQIGLSGNTGRSTGPHLHWETWTGGKPVNPAAYLNGAMLPEGGVSGDGGGFNPLQALFDLKDKMVGNFTDQFGSNNMLAQIASGALSRLFTGPLDWITAKAKAIGDFGQDVWGNTKDWLNGKDSDVQSAVRGVAAGYGWDSGRHWSALSKLISKESSWNPNAQNPSSTAYGLFQFLNSTWGSYGAKTSDPAGQARAGLKYIQDRYGDPKKALAFHKKNNWYANGGRVTPVPAFAKGGLAKGLALVGENGPELANFSTTARISTADMTSRILDGAGLQTQLAATQGLGAGYMDAILKSIEVTRHVSDGRGFEGIRIDRVELPPRATVDDLVGALKFEKRMSARGGVR